MFTSGEFALAVAPEPLSVPVPMLVPTLVVPSHEPVGIGPQRKNVTVPLGMSVAWFPVTVAVSWTATPGKTGPGSTWVAKVAVFSWLTYVQVTSPLVFRMIVAV